MAVGDQRAAYATLHVMGSFRECGGDEHSDPKQSYAAQTLPRAVMSPAWRGYPRPTPAFAGSRITSAKETRSKRSTLEG